MLICGSRLGWTLLIALITSCAPAGALAGVASDQDGRFHDPVTENVEAFARLYGHVRFFHPSDEAASVDWDRMAILGVGRVASSRTPEDLQRELERLFLPIAPTVRIYTGEAAPVAASGRKEREDQGSLVAWQHYGGGFAPWSFYSSTRTDRPGMLGGRELTRIVQAVPVGELRGRHVRLRAGVRTDVAEGMGNARLTFMVARPGTQGYTDEMSDRPITDDDWQVYEIIGRVDEDATALIVGMSMWGSGTAWYDAFELAVNEDGGDWSVVPLQNPDMEVGTDNTIHGWSPWTMAAGPPDHGFAASREHPFRGETSAFLRVDQPLELFDSRPDPGAVADVVLGRGLRASVPLTLPSRGGRTVPAVDPELISALTSDLSEVDLSRHDLDDANLRLGNVVIAWTALRHFYPYAHEVDTGWDSLLRRTLEEAARASGPYEYLRSLQRMMAALHDGHARVDHPILSRRYPLPLALEWVEDQIVVTASRDTAEIRPGDVVVAIDGRDANDLILAEMAHASGSEGLRRLVALNRVGRGEPGSLARVWLRRGVDEMAVTLTRGHPSPPVPSRLPPVTALADDVYYVDLVRVGLDDLAPRLDELAMARGIVFDVRGYPGHDAFHLLRHLSDRPISWARMCTPMVVYPAWDPVPDCDAQEPQLYQPLQPRINGPFAFLTDARAISFAEVVMGAVEYQGLGEIIGHPTAGANGNQNGLTLPGGIQLAWTGMIVRKLDGSPHHAVGIQPTIPVERTVEGIREGRDEFLEAALRALGKAHADPARGQN